MSNPTSNFGWQMPTPTDLVTSLPADFEVFGQAVDSSMADLKGGTTGQILSKATNTDMDFVWTSANPGDITGITATSPLTGGGTSGDVTVGILSGTTSNLGAVQLSTSTSSTSTSLAATASAVKSAYDLADAAIAKSTLTTAGDTLYRNATVPVRLGIGTAGQVLTVNSGATAPEWTTISATIPTSYGYAAGKNAIINGDFRINQRSFTSNTTSGAFNFDRWLQANSGGTFTVTPQTFTPGAAPVAGYEGSTFLRGVTATQSAVGDFALFEQKIEDVRTFAGSTVTVSFWAKAATGTPKIGLELSQNFGSGGSPSATVNTALGAVTISTSWTRYSVSVAVPSISGKTIGTTANTSYVEANSWVSAGSTLATRASSIGIQNNTFDIWGFQIENGSTATAFQTATGTLQGELAMCQRYYYRHTASTVYNAYGMGSGVGTTGANIFIQNPITMRTKPTSVDFSNVTIYDQASFITVTNLTINSSTEGTNATLLTATVAASGVQFRPYVLMANNTTSSYVGLSAEL
jgi:hypothetical protein